MESKYLLPSSEPTFGYLTYVFLPPSTLLHLFQLSASWHFKQKGLSFSASSILTLDRLCTLYLPTGAVWCFDCHPCVGHCHYEAIHCDGPDLSPTSFFDLYPSSLSSIPSSNPPPRRIHHAMLNELSTTLVGDLARMRSATSGPSSPCVTMLISVFLQAGLPTKPIPMVRSRATLSNSNRTRAIDVADSVREQEKTLPRRRYTHHGPSSSSSCS